MIYRNIFEFAFLITYPSTARIGVADGEQFSTSANGSEARISLGKELGEKAIV
jgi:hypothetical protein